MKNSKIAKVLLSMTGLIILSKLLGFVKQIVVADIFGATIETDLLNLSQGFIGNTQYLLAQSLLTALVTVYIYTKDRDGQDAKRLAFAALEVFTVIGVGAAVLVAVLAPWLAKFLAPTYSTELSAALSRYLRMFAPVLVLLVWTAAFNALLHANKRFIPGEMISVFQSLLSIGLVLALYDTMGIKALVVSFFTYTLWNAAYTAILSRQYLSPYRGNPFKNQAVKEILHMMVPLLIGYSVIYVNQLVDKILASGLPEGTVTALYYGSVLSNLVATFVVTFASIFFPYVTDSISRREQKKAAEMTNWTAVLMVLVFLPVSIITVICADDIVTVVYARGAFDAESAAICAKALRGYGLMFVPLVLREVYSRFIYGYQDSRRPMFNSSISIAVNIALSILLCPEYGVLGITFATSVAVGICSVLNMISARHHNAELHYGSLARALPWLLAGGSACTLMTMGANCYLAGDTPLIRFILVTLCSGAVYALCVSPLLIRLLRQYRENK